MDIGVHYARFTHPGWQDRLEERLVATARAADTGGAALFTVMDHWFQMESLGGPAEPMLVTLMPHGDDPIAWTERVCGEVLPRLRDL